MATAEFELVRSLQPHRVAIEDGTATQRILVVEDEAFLCRVVQQLLRDANYEVIAAKSANQAVETLSNYDQKIDLLLTDVVLPGPDGWWLAERLITERPGLKAVLMSGYGEHAMKEHEESANIFYLVKPFTGEILIRKIREVLAV
jgi:DNA-binding NtrC family response regulator